MVIGHNPKLFEKKLWSELGDGEPVRVIECDNEEHEAERVVARIAGAARRAVARGASNGVAAAVEWQRLRRAVPRQPPGAGLREGAAQGRTSRTRSRAARASSTAPRSRTCAPGCACIVNNDDDPAFLRAVTTPQARHRPPDAGHAGRIRRAVEDEPVRGTVRREPGAACSSARALGSLHEFGRYMNDLEYRARQTVGAEDAKVLLLDWLKDIDYEKHLHDGEDSEKLAAARWSNVLDFVDWIAKRCGGEIENDGGGRDRGREEKRARGGADDFGDHQPGRARRRPERGHAVDAACGQGPRVAARRAGRRQRGPAAVSQRRRRDDRRSGSRKSGA